MKQEKTASGNVLVSEPVEEVVAEPKPCVVPCSVSVGARQTIPTGDYSNVQLSVHLSVTCEPSEIDEAFEAVKEWVGEKLGNLAEEALTSLNGG